MKQLLLSKFLSGFFIFYNHAKKHKLEVDFATRNVYVLFSSLTLQWRDSVQMA